MRGKPGLFSLLSKYVSDWRACRAPLLARLIGDEDGNWLIMSAVAFPILIGVAGLGTEAGLLFYQHRSLQSAADAAAYSSAIAYSYSASADITTQAQSVVASYGFTLGSGTNQAYVTATTTTYASLPAVQVTISRPQTAIFSSLFFSTLPNAVSATAVLDSSKSGGCMLALGKNPATGTNNEANAIYLQGNPTINASNCGIFSDSTDCVQGSYAESLGGNSTINVGSFGGAGCTTIFGHAQVNLSGGVTCSASDSSSCTQQDGTISDPYAGMALPSTPAAPCQQQPAGTTLSPGRYCGLTVNNSNGLTLSAGTYILDCSSSTCPTDQGTTTMLDVKNGQLNGTGVTLVFTCSTCTTSSQWASDGMLVAANGSVSLTAPGPNATAGVQDFVIIGDPNMPLNTAFDLHSNPTACLDGTVYAPSARFLLGGTPATGCSNSNFCQQMIVNTLTFQGNTTSNFNTGGCTLGGGQKPIGSIVTLVD